MKRTAWLTINRKGSMKITKGQPGLDWDEISMKLSVELPSEIFNRPRLSASITIPQEAAQTKEINVDVIEDCKDAIKQATGLEMNIQIIKDEPDTEEIVK